VKSDVERALERRRKGPDGRRGAAAGAPSGAGRSPAEPAAESAPAVPVARGELGTAIEHSRLRRAVASRMAESKRTVPHFYTTVAVRMDDALRLKDALALRDPDARVSVSHLIVKASALALERWPRVNAVFEEDRIRIPGGIHVGLAVAVEDGLIVPVIRDCQAKGLREIASEARALVERVRRGRLAQDDLQGATFSVSNMGMFEIESFAAIIAPPQAAILAVGGIADEAVVRDGRVVPGKVMRLTLSADHRAIDGSLAAAFLVEVRRFLENPLSLVV
jgi:pyruvate dehydrogenase E2 component (dihydrolipoamide acetyltransferase)